MFTLSPIWTNSNEETLIETKRVRKGKLKLIRHKAEPSLVQFREALLCLVKFISLVFPIRRKVGKSNLNNEKRKRQKSRTLGVRLEWKISLQGVLSFPSGPVGQGTGQDSTRTGILFHSINPPSTSLLIALSLVEAVTVTVWLSILNKYFFIVGSLNDLFMLSINYPKSFAVLPGLRQICTKADSLKPDQAGQSESRR